MFWELRGFPATSIGNVGIPETLALLAVCPSPPAAGATEVFRTRRLKHCLCLWFWAALVLAFPMMLTACHACGSPSSNPSLERTIPDEASDASSLLVVSDWQALPHRSSSRYEQQSSFDSQGDKQHDSNNFICRGPTTPALNNVPECPADLRVRGAVMARFEGSGRLARLWLTATSLRKRWSSNEVLLFYVDDESSPRLAIPLSELLRGEGSEMFGGPFGAARPLYAAWYYPVVFASKLVVTLHTINEHNYYFYHVAAVLDDPPIPRKAGSTRLAERDAALTVDSKAIDSLLANETLALNPGDAHKVTLSGPATITRFGLELSSAMLVAARDVLLRIQWDDAPNAAVDLPLADFFASSHGSPEHSSLALQVSHLEEDRIQLALTLPMPFATRAQIALENHSSQRLDAKLTLHGSKSLPEPRWGHLHTQLHSTTQPPPNGIHPFAVAPGPGRLVGACAFLRGHGVSDDTGFQGQPMQFLEGDVNGYVDGKMAMPGTGTEDYFNSAFYFGDGGSGTPYAQVWNVSERDADDFEYASVNACRWHVLGDTIDFQRSLDLHLEAGPGIPETLDEARSVAYLYL